jgi:hypothetical protein
MPPLIFVIHRWNGMEYPALYHDDRLPPKHDAVVYSVRLNKLPNGDELANMTLDELDEYFDAARELGVLPAGNVGRSEA